MPYIQREEGRIVGLFNLAQPGIAEEFLADDDAEVVAYRTPAPSPLDQLEALITQGQIAMEEAPLPKELRKQIFDLEILVQNYYKRGDTDLILDAIASFEIPDGYPGVTQGQRAQVEALKTQMLAVFNA